MLVHTYEYTYAYMHINYLLSHNLWALDFDYDLILMHLLLKTLKYAWTCTGVQVCVYLLNIYGK